MFKINFFHTFPPKFNFLDKVTGEHSFIVIHSSFPETLLTNPKNWNIQRTQSRNQFTVHVLMYQLVEHFLNIFNLLYMKILLKNLLINVRFILKIKENVLNL